MNLTEFFRCKVSSNTIDHKKRISFTLFLQEKEKNFRVVIKINNNIKDKSNEKGSKKSKPDEKHQ